jgi:hypothetical protein
VCVRAKSGNSSVDACTYSRTIDSWLPSSQTFDAYYSHQSRAVQLPFAFVSLHHILWLTCVTFWEVALERPSLLIQTLPRLESI